MGLGADLCLEVPETNVVLPHFSFGLPKAEDPAEPHCTQISDLQKKP